MDSCWRTIAKTITWQTCGFVSMSVLAWAVTGSWTAGGAIALGGAVLGTLSYVVHERVWAAIRWGRAP